MTGQDFQVPPRSWDWIDDYADRFRSHFGLADVPHFPVVDVIERVLDYKMNFCRFEVGDADEMGGAEGLTCPKGEFIMLRSDVYRGAINDDGRDRFTAAHELGHRMLHTNVPLARAMTSGRIDAFKRSEPQANQFAAGLLMPRRFFRKSDTPMIVMARHGVTQSAAENRLEFLRGRKII